MESVLKISASSAVVHTLLNLYRCEEIGWVFISWADCSVGPSECFKVQMLPLGCTFCGGGLSVLTGWCLLMSGTSQKAQSRDSLRCCGTARAPTFPSRDAFRIFTKGRAHTYTQIPLLCLIVLWPSEAAAQSWSPFVLTTRVVFVCFSVFLCTRVGVRVCVLREFPSVAWFSHFDSTSPTVAFCLFLFANS